MDLPVELVGLLKLQVNSSAISIKLIWIKAEKPVVKTGEVASQARYKNT